MTENVRSWRHPRRAAGGLCRRVKRAAIDRIPRSSMKPWSADKDADWWFAGTAVPLLAATIGPLANVFSIAALVTPWRMCLVDGVEPRTCPWDGKPESLVTDLLGHAFSDPKWCFKLNILSLALGFVGNVFLLFNFTGFVRYIIALPTTIFMWFLATGILIGITVSMHMYVPPIQPYQTYTQGFWYAVLAAILYMVVSVLLMVNMLGYFLGHFPQHFDLSDSQRTLILQTMMFFVWLAGGGGVFAKVESTFGDGSLDWSYANSLYFSDVTILTVGFGDMSCTSSIGRGLVFPYSVGGIVMLGLVISSISKFATEIGSTKVIDKHRERSRARTAERVVTSPEELRRRLHGSGLSRAPSVSRSPPRISAPFDPVNQSARLRIPNNPPKPDRAGQAPPNSSPVSFLQRSANMATQAIVPSPLRKKKKKKPRPILLAEERDRFNTMRRLEYQNKRWKSWTSLSVATISFSLVWLLGALVFFFAEAGTQQLTYFEALYFCYVSLLTIGYGDLAPKSNVGRPFFVLWSLIAVPTMTILVGAMGGTVIRAFKRGVEKGAEVTILPRRGLFGEVLRDAGIIGKVEERKARKDLERRLERGFETGLDDGPSGPTADRPLQKLDRNDDDTIEKVDTDATSTPPPPDPPETDLDLVCRLAAAIQAVAQDLRQVHPVRRYEYDEWLEFTRLIRSTGRRQHALDRIIEGRRGKEGGGKLGRLLGEELGGADDINDDDDDDDGVDDQKQQRQDLIEWDWIGEDSPMMAKQTEPEFVLDRLCESLARWARSRAARERKGERETGVGVVEAAGGAGTVGLRL